jgi:hypothetical protein
MFFSETGFQTKENLLQRRKFCSMPLATDNYLSRTARTPALCNAVAKQAFNLVLIVIPPAKLLPNKQRTKNDDMTKALGPKPFNSGAKDENKPTIYFSPSAHMQSFCNAQQVPDLESRGLN